MNLKTLILATAVALSPLTVLAQTPAPTPAAPVTLAAKPTINQRKENQQDRIGQGVTSGKLTPGETSHLEHQEAGINKEEHGMRAQDNGKLTKGDRSLLNKQQNQESRRIARDKHNGK